MKSLACVMQGRGTCSLLFRDQDGGEVVTYSVISHCCLSMFPGASRLSVKTKLLFMIRLKNVLKTEGDAVTMLKKKKRQHLVSEKLYVHHYRSVHMVVKGIF